MLDQHRDWFGGLETRTAKIFAVLPFAPDQYTSFSIVSAAICAGFTAFGDYWQAIAFLVLASAMDFVDGAVARFKGLSSARGAYWDTIADRCCDAMILFGLLFVPLPAVVLPGYAWIFAILFGSMMTTYAKAAAKEKGLSEVELKGGLMSRAERSIFVIAIFLLLIFARKYSTYAIILLAVLANLTALQRIRKALIR